MNKKNDVVPDRYKQTKFDDYVTRAKESYSRGEVIEAFVVLYGIVEVMMLSLWGTFVMDTLKKHTYAIPNGVWDYNELVKLLYEFNLINDSQRSVFLDFKKGRNEAVHYLGKYFNDKISMKELDQRFQKGLKAWNIIHKLL